MEFIRDLGLRESNIIRNGKPRKFTWALYKCRFCDNTVERIKGKMKVAPKSCGCLSGEKHGQHKTKLYEIWKRMKERCNNPNNPKYSYYGGKGVKVCTEWANSFLNFKNWSDENGYIESNTSIDRRNSNGNYEPSNCRWTTRCVQSRNTVKLNKTNTTGFRGVSIDKRGVAKPYRAYITVSNKTISLGYHTNALDAAKAYDTYVIINNLEHTINGVLHEPIRL